MHRRSFLTAIVGVAGAAALAGVATKAEAANIMPAVAGDEPTAEGFFKKLGEMDNPDVEKAHYTGYYHRHYYRRRYRRCRLVRTYYGWVRRCWY